VLTPVRVRVPAPFLTSEPEPEIALAEKFVPWAMLSLRLKTRTPLLVMVLLVERLPVVPPLPICRVPTEMRVPPL